MFTLDLDLDHLDLLLFGISETEIKLFIVFLGDYFIIILSKFTFIIFQEREEKSDHATAAIGEAKAKDVSGVFFLYFYSIVTYQRK